MPSFSFGRWKAWFQKYVIALTATDLYNERWLKWQILCYIWASIQVLSRVWAFGTPRTVAHRALLSMGFPRQNTGVGCHVLFQGLFLIQGLNPLLCLHSAGRFFTTVPPGKLSHHSYKKTKMKWNDISQRSKNPSTFTIKYCVLLYTFHMYPYCMKLFI